MDEVFSITGGWLLLDKSIISNTELVYTQLRCIKTGFTKKYKNNTTACLLVSTTTENYASAESACKASGTRLYTVKTQDKLDILLTITRFLNISFWIGLDDRANEGLMKWSDGTALDATWGNIILPSSNKGNQDLEDCVEYNPLLYPFNDNDCSLKNRYICEMTTAS
ncbi:C-type lectin domain family 4 member M-like [Physella acuta]|uniref:C-type lectin domain family 4 member M-like n=1 Tax=Physella acuta TaxID=109671 RepID=UPI0027DB84E2|nr:C-type lectin domain family 4 member M-like [Physella acuta]